MPDADRLCLLQVHAHPDDEASKGAGTTAKYAAEGVRNVLVCCTGGEAGDILNPAVEHPGTRRSDARDAHGGAATRACACSATTSLHLLGYHDSGMPDTETNARPDNFANAPLDEAVGRLVQHHPRRAPAGHHHVPRRPRLLPASRSHPRARDLGARRSTLAGDPEAYPGARRAVAAVEAVLRRLVDRAREGAARGVPRSAARRARTRRGSSAASTRTAPTTSRRSSTSATSCTSAGRRCSRTARRSIPRASGCGSPTTSSARCSRGRSSPSPGRSSTRRARRRVRRRPVRRHPRST